VLNAVAETKSNPTTFAETVIEWLSRLWQAINTTLLSAAHEARKKTSVVNKKMMLTLEVSQYGGHLLPKSLGGHLMEATSSQSIEQRLRTLSQNRAQL
jgi:hypothetical protein